MTDPKVEEKQKETTQGSQDYSDVEENKQTEVTKCPVCG
jgi:adenine-specific DNA methylase